MPANPPRAPGELADEIERRFADGRYSFADLAIFTKACLPDILAALRAPQGDGAETKEWWPTGAGTCMFNGVGGTVEWFRPADGQTRSFPTHFDPNVGAYVGLSFSSSTLPALDQHSLTKNEGGSER